MRRLWLSLALLVSPGLCAAALVAAEIPTFTTSANHRPRVWTDDSGQFQITATLVAVRGDRLLLLKTNGNYTMPPIARLSAADRDYVAALGRPAELPTPAIGPGPAPQAAATQVTAKPAAADTRLPKQLLPVSIPERDSLPPASVDDADAEEPVRLMYVVISRKFFDSLLPAQVNEVRPVRNVIVGTTFAGNSRTTGRSRLEFVPNPWQATFALRFTGTSVSDSVGGDRVQIYSRAYTWLDASKRVLLDESGFHGQPTQSTASSLTQTLGLGTNLPGLRGNLALRIAGRRIESTRPQANAESAWHARANMSREMDRRLAKPLANWNAICQELLAAARQGDYELGARASTTDDQLRLVIHRKTPSGKVPAEPLPAPIDGGPQIAVWIHNSLIKRVMNDSNLQQALQPLVARLTAHSGLAARGEAGVPDYRINWSDGGKWMTVSVGLPAQDENRMASAQN